jgi:hypothetical protein
MTENPIMGDLRGPLDDDDERTSLERALDARRRGEPTPPLSDDLQQLVDDLAPWLDDLRAAAQEIAAEAEAGLFPTDRAQVMPESVRADDPIALMLGLVSDPSVAIDGHKLALARKRARLDLKDLVSRLRHRGWTVETREALEWHKGSAVVPPALIRAIASELRVDENALLTRPERVLRPDDLFDDAQITAFIAEWAAEADIQPIALRNQVSSLLAGASRRNSTTSSAETLLAILKTLRAIPNLLDPT